MTILPGFSSDAQGPWYDQDVGRTGLRGMVLIVLWPLVTACPQLGLGHGPDAGPPDFVSIDVRGNDRAYINNLVGRWFTEAEIRRLDDDTLTPEEWCKREPAYVLVLLDTVTIRCPGQETYSAGISRVAGGNGTVTISLRGKEDSKLRQLVFRQVFGTTALIAGSPCDEQEMPYARFPRLEILKRQILGGSSCAQVQGAVGAPTE